MRRSEGDLSPDQPPRRRKEAVRGTFPGEALGCAGGENESDRATADIAWP